MQGGVGGLVDDPVRVIELLEVAAAGIARLGLAGLIPMAQATVGVAGQLQIGILLEQALVDGQLEQQVVQLHRFAERTQGNALDQLAHVLAEHHHFIEGFGRAGNVAGDA